MKKFTFRNTFAEVIYGPAQRDNLTTGRVNVDV